MKMLCCPLISTPPFHLHSKNLNEELKHFSRPVAPFFSFFFLWGISSIKIAGPQDQLPLQVLSFLLAASLFYSPEPSRRVLTGGLDFCKGGYRACHSPAGRIEATGGQKRTSGILTLLLSSICDIPCVSCEKTWRADCASFNGSSVRFLRSARGRRQGRTHLHGQEPRLCAHLQGIAERRHLLRVSTRIPAHP